MSPASAALRGREPLTGAAQNRRGTCRADWRAAVCPHAGPEPWCPPQEETLRAPTAQDALGTGASGRAHSTAVQPCPASGANSADRPFEAPVWGPHVLLFSEAPGGERGRVRPQSTKGRGGTPGEENAQARKPGGQPTRQPTSRHHAPRAPATSQPRPPLLKSRRRTSVRRSGLCPMRSEPVGETRAGGSSVPGGVGAALAGGRALLQGVGA